MWLTVEYWRKIMHMDVEDRVRQCCERQKGNMRVERWAKQMKGVSPTYRIYIICDERDSKINIMDVYCRKLGINMHIPGNRTGGSTTVRY
jgi:hypothetical protein